VRHACATTPAELCYLPVCCRRFRPRHYARAITISALRTRSARLSAPRDALIVAYSGERRKVHGARSRAAEDALLSCPRFAEARSARGAAVQRVSPLMPILRV